MILPEFAPTLILAAAIVAILVAPKGRDWSTLHAHDAWACTLFMLWLGTQAPTLYVGAVIVIIGLGIVWAVYPSTASITVGWRTGMIVALYLLMIQQVDAWMAPWFFAILASCGLWLGARAFVYGERRCNQLNPNLAESVMALCASAGLALGWYVEAWWGILAVAILVIMSSSPIRNQGIGHLVVAGLAALTVVYGWRVWIGGVPLLGVGLLLARHDAGLQVRWQMWQLATQAVWRQGWKRRLIGNGMASWRTLPGAVNSQAEWPDPHNEAVHLFREYGLLGVGSVLVMLGDLAWRLSDHPLLIVGMTMCSVAALNAPWTLIRSTLDPNDRTNALWYGSPALTVLSLMIMALAEAVP